MSPRKVPRMEPNRWTMQPLARQTRPLTAGRYEEKWAHSGRVPPRQSRAAARTLDWVGLEYPQMTSVVWCADVAAGLSATRRCDLPLGFGATTMADDVALALRVRHRVLRGRESVEVVP